MGISVSRLALVIGALALLGNIVLGAMCLQQQRERDSLTSDTAAARASLEGYGALASYEERLAAAEKRLAAEQDYFPHQVSSTSSLNDVLRLAEEGGVDIVNIEALPKGKEEIGAHTYYALSFHLTVKGDMPALQTFISGLEGGTLRGAAIDEVDIYEFAEFATASLSFTIYARR